jgi:4-amino-4-deoxy-L-arabinose transferase-like glycosyltransferase
MLGAPLLDAGVRLELALRIWPFLFTIGGLWLTGAFARLLAEGEPWSGPLAITLVFSSAQVWDYARSAMLDSGQSFFLLAALYSTFRALKNPRWWIATGIMLGLGTLQKAPVGLLAVVVVLASSNRFGDPPTFQLRSLLYDRSFRWGAGIFAFLFLYWPVIQVSRFGLGFLSTFFGKQMLSRFQPDSEVAFRWIGWLTGDSPIVGILYLASLLVALTVPHFRGRMALRSTALFVVLACVALTLASGRTFSRYLVPLIPLCAAVLSAVMVKLVPKPAIAAAVGAALLVLQVPTLSKIPDNIYERDQSDIRKASELVAAHLRDTESPVFVSPFGFAHFPPGAFILYADLDRHVLISRWDRPEQFTQMAKLHSALPPYMGVAHREHISIVEEMVGPIQVFDRVGDWMIWRQHDPEPKAHLNTTDGIHRDD